MATKIINFITGASTAVLSPPTPDWQNVGNAVDSTAGTYATSSTKSSALTMYMTGLTVAPQRYLGKITKVELGTNGYWYTNGGGSAAGCQYVPVFGGTTAGAGTYSCAAYTQNTDDGTIRWVDITSDANVPTGGWNWNVINGIQMRCTALLAGNKASVAVDQMYIRVTYTPDTTNYIRAFN